MSTIGNGLIRAAAAGDANEVQKLIANAALYDLNIVDKVSPILQHFLHLRDQSHQMPRIWAVMLQDGRSALMWASAVGNSIIVDLLMKAGADINKENEV